MWHGGCPCSTREDDRERRPEIVGRSCGMDFDGFLEQWGDSATALIVTDGDDDAPDIGE